MGVTHHLKSCKLLEIRYNHKYIDYIYWWKYSLIELYRMVNN